jgi:hypothetical protein
MLKHPSGYNFFVTGPGLALRDTKSRVHVGTLLDGVLRRHLLR